MTAAAAAAAILDISGDVYSGAACPVYGLTDLVGMCCIVHISAQHIWQGAQTPESTSDARQ